MEAIIYEINLHVYNYIKTNKLLKLKETGFKSLAIPYPGWWRKAKMGEVQLKKIYRGRK